MQGRIQGGVLWVNPLPPFEKFFQFARVFQENNPKTPPKFFRLYKKNISKPLPRKISGYIPASLYRLRM